MPEATISKSCTKCKILKSGGSYYRSKRNSDGLQGSCKDCARAFHLANEDREKIRKAAWAIKNLDVRKIKSAIFRAANSVRLAAVSAKWRAENKDKKKAIDATWRDANKEKERVSRATYYLANREKLVAAGKIWRKANPEALAVISQNRRASKKKAGGKLSKDLVGKLMTLQAGKCPCCRQPLGADYHLDHIQPLALGGSNTDENIQLLRAVCNHQKRAKHPIDFMQSRGFLL